jgi:tryptophan synthase alpha chain
VTESRISGTFRKLRAAGQMAFMPFLTAGDPDLEATLCFVRELSDRGADLIEIGFPYSDPIADGPVIQASYTRALARRLQVADILAAVEQLTHAGSSAACAPLPPLVAMVAYAIVYRTGPERFLARAAQAGFAGLIIPDLPSDEAAEVAALARKAGLDLIELIAPTTSPARAVRILSMATGFVYCVSVAGITGVRTELPSKLADQLRFLRSQTPLPLAVGFGVSRPAQVPGLRGLADGVIVGSAIVGQIAAAIEEGKSIGQVASQIGNFAAAMLAETRKPGGAASA